MKRRNLGPPAWVSPPLLLAITADTEELIQGNWMLPESLHQSFWVFLLSVGNCLSYLYCLQPKGKQESRAGSDTGARLGWWLKQEVMTVISSILTALLRMIYPHPNSFKHSESAQPTPVTVRPPPPPVTPPPLSIFNNFSSIISSAKIVFHIEGLAISLSHFRWWYQGQSEISLPPSLSMYF